MVINGKKGMNVLAVAMQSKRMLEFFCDSLKILMSDLQSKQYSVVLFRAANTTLFIPQRYPKAWANKR